MTACTPDPVAPTPSDLARLSLNTATTKAWTLREAVEGAVRAGLPAVGLWRDRVHEAGLDDAARIVREAGLRVSSLCRGGFLTADDPDGIAAALEDNRAAVVEAATLGTRELVLVVGGLPAASAPGGPALPYPEPPSGPAGTPDPARDLVAARRRVADRLADLVPFAAEHGVRLVLEPLHPMFAADRAVISTLGQALELAAPFPAGTVGVVVDTYHVWWDPDLERQIARAGREGRLAGYQVCDWVLPLAADPLLSRGHVGDGYVDVPTITRWVAEAGYTGDVEVEIFNQQVWDAPGDRTLATLRERYLRHVRPFLEAARSATADAPVRTAPRPVGHLDIAGTDPGATSSFFAELLGWDVDHRPHGYTSFSDGRLTGGFPDLVHGFAPVRAVLREGDVLPYVEMDDLDEALVRVRALGGEVLLEPTEAAPGHWLAVVRAPGGAKLALTRIVRR